MLGAQMYRLGAFILDARHRLLLKEGQRVDLAKKPYAILVYLVESRDRLVTRRELIDRFWDGKDVYDQTMSRAIARIRNALSDSRGDSHYIETRWATGYQYIGPFEEIPDSESQLVLNPVREDSAPGHSRIDEVLPPNPARLDPPNAHRGGSTAYRSAIFATVFFALLLIGIFSLARLYHLRRPGNAVAASAFTPNEKVRKAIAVMPFKNLTGNSADEWLTTAIPEMISTDLSGDGRVRIVPGAEVDRAVTELRLEHVSDLTPAKLNAVHQDLFADLVVTGSYVVLDSGPASLKRMRIDLKLLDSRSGDVVLSCSESGRLEELFEMTASADSRVMSSLIPQQLKERSKLDAALPSDPDAMRAYMEGLRSLRTGGFATAQAHFENSIALEPAFPLAHLMLADAWGMRGYQEKQRAEAKLAESLSGDLGREQRLLVAGRYASTVGEWDKAIEAYRTLYAFFPDNLDYALALANAQTSAGKPQEAEATLRTLRMSSTPFHDDPRIDLAAAGAAQSMSNSRQAVEDSQHAIDKARKSGARLLYAHALAVHAGNMAGIDIRQSIRESEEVRRICTEMNDIGCVANDLRRLGIFQVNSDPAAAEVDFREALGMARRTGNLAEEDNDLNGLAAILSNQGKLGKADAIYRELLRHAHQMNSGWGIQMALNNLGNDLFLEGNLVEAKQMQEEALRISRQIGLKAAAADELLSLAQINLAEADTLDAKRDAEEALSIFTKLQNEEEKAVVHSLLGDIERVSNNLDWALKDQQKAEDRLLKLGEVAVLAEVRLELARSSLDAGNVQDVIRLSQSAAKEFARQERRDEEASARATLALALTQQGSSELAKREMLHALSLIANAHDEIPRDEVQIDAMLFQARFPQSACLNDVKRAVEPVGQLAERADRMHLKLISMDARIAEAELALKSSSIQENQSRLERIETEARRVGDLRVATRAKHLMGLLVQEEIKVSNEKGAR